MAEKKSVKATKKSASKTTSAKSGKGGVHFNKRDLKDLKDSLVKLRNDLLGKVAYLHDSSLRRDNDVINAEDGSDAFDRIVSLGRAGDVQQRINAIDEALREIEEGSYGVCQSCDSLIGKERLLALPFARNCIECQEESERLRGGNSKGRQMMNG